MPKWNQHMRNVSAETHMSLCERKISFAHAQESNHDPKCESNQYPSNCEFLSKIGKLSLNNSELKLQYQPIPEARVRGP